MLGITFFYLGQKAKYIDCLSKLIDLATELDFVEREYDLASIKKGKNEISLSKEVLHDKNEDTLESKEVLMKELKHNFHEDSESFEKKKDFKQHNHESQIEVKKKIVNSCDDNRVNVNKTQTVNVNEAQTVQDNENKTGLKAKIEETTEEIQGVKSQSEVEKKIVNLSDHNEVNVTETQKVNFNETKTVQDNENETGLKAKIKETTEEIQGVKKDDNKCTPPVRKKDSVSGSFHCNFCDKSYMEERTLRDHVKFRHNREGFICTICNHLSRNKRDLRCHVDGIHGTPKYLCNVCGSKFTQKTGLRTHTQAVHEKLKYDCNECTHVSTTLSSLGWHMKQKHTSILYSCEKCAFKCRLNIQLRKHVKKVHGQPEKNSDMVL